MKHRRIESRSPTRVDLAGGTLDLWPLYLFHPGSVTVNLAINVMTQATLIPRSDHQIILSSEDSKIEKAYKDLSQVPTTPEGDLALLRAHVNFWKPEGGFELHTKSESPIGGGIAGSSSLNVSLYGAFSEWMQRKFSVNEAVRLVGNLEAQVINAPTGCQDYFPALCGGMNVVDLSPLGPQNLKTSFDKVLFKKHFILVYTGRPHHSGLNNWQIFKDHIDGQRHTIDCLERLKQVAVQMVSVCREKRYEELGKLFDEEYKARVDLSSVFASPEILKLRDLAMSEGAQALKICGAGGGGCVFLWCPEERRKNLENQCQLAGFQVIPAVPVEDGLEVKAT